MAFLTTGLVNNPPLQGVRPSSSLSVLLTNNDVATDTVHVRGFYQVGNTKTLYVEELFSLRPGEVAIRDYYANFDNFEFNFIVSSPAIAVTLWGKDAQGNLQTAHRVVAQELEQFES